MKSARSCNLLYNDGLKLILYYRAVFPFLGARTEKQTSKCALKIMNKVVG